MRHNTIKCTHLKQMIRGMKKGKEVKLLGALPHSPKPCFQVAHDGYDGKDGGLRQKAEIEQIWFVDNEC